MTALNEGPMNLTPAKPSEPNLKTVLPILVFGGLGALFGGGAIHLLRFSGFPLKSLSGFDLIALLLGVMYVGVGLILAFMAGNRQRLGRGLNIADADTETFPATRAEIRTAFGQASVLFLAGILLLAPVLVQGPMRTHPGIAAPVYAGIFLLFLVQTGLNIQLWRSSDEFVRKTILAALALTFAVSQSLLFLWAAAEKLRMAPVIGSWDVFTALMACYLGVNFVVGLAMRRTG